MASQTADSLLRGISKEDCTLLAKSFKDKKFRQLLCDYAREVTDPENRKQFEEEVIEYEKERGVEAVFIHPSPGFALALRGNGDAAGFVNICSSDVVQKPDLQAVSGGDKKCHKWSLPHAVPKPRREVVHDHRVRSRKPAVVHDVVFHPEALQLALDSPVIKQSLIDTALDSLRKHFSVEIGEVEEVEEKQYIGMPAQSIIKRKVDQKHFQADEQKSAYKDHRTNMIDNSVVNVSEKKMNEESKFVEPKYKLKYVRKMDLQDFSVQLIPQCSPPWQPQALELEVNLPRVLRASQVNCDIQHQSVLLTTESDPKYKLELPLRYSVDEDRSTAKFDVSTQKLTLTLAVVLSSKNSDQLGSQGQSPPSDSGIECEFDSRTNGDSDTVSDESVSSQDDGAKDVSGVTGGEEEDNVFDPPSTEYKLTLAPNYSVQQTKESLCIFLCCGNVLPSSIKVEQVDDMNAGIELSSIGGGQTLLHYSLKVDVSPHKIAASGLSHKEEEGKIVLMIKKAMNELWETCKIGHGDALTVINLPATGVTDEEEKPKNESAEEKQDNSKSCACVVRSPRMARTVSMCETEASHPFRLRGPTCSWPRGILKHRVRSLSESQVGTFSSSALLGATSSSLDLEVFENKPRYGDEEEEEESVEESVSSSLGEKKSVRFNEVVSRQLFRSNSSILGQRAKNQRKAIRKRKSQARRESESEKDAGINTSSGDSDLTTDAATDDDTDATNSNATEVDADSHATDPKNNSNIKRYGDILELLRPRKNNNNVCKSTGHNNGNNNNNSDDNSNNNSDKSDLINENIDKEDEEDNNDFIIKTSKKKKRKNRKNKMPGFEPTNTLIFQLDMDK